MITPIPVARVPHEWGGILSWLRPAFKWSNTTPGELLAELSSGAKTAYRLSGDVEGIVVASLGMTRDTDALAVWINWAGGRADGLDAMRAVISEIEQIGQRRGATEARAAGRPGWVRVFRTLGYQRLPDEGRVARLRKELGHAGR